MSPLSRESILAALQDIVDISRVSGVVVRGGNVGFLLQATPETAAQMEPLRRECERRIGSLPGVEKVTAVLTAETAAPTPEKTQPAQWNRTPLEGIGHVVAVASGKGGVGKSTTTVCLAYALSARGLKVGILDADIYGPSIPLMMGVSGQPDVVQGKMLPKIRDGIACMSIGLILGEDAAIMRAPMITKALNQMLRAVAWGELDVLLVDLPPGTGDVHLSLAQQAPLSGAIVVTTPQLVAVADARKAVDMFRKTSVPVLGIVENMSYLEQGEQKIALFGEGGGENLAKQMATLFLGHVPLLPALGASLDSGLRPALPSVFSGIGEKIMCQLPFRE